MQLIKTKIALNEIKELTAKGFGDFIKAVVDIEKEIMAIDAELHADEEALLLENGSKQENLWGINIYPSQPKAERIEFDSMINLKPSQGNRSRTVEDKTIQEKIIRIVAGKPATKRRGFHNARNRDFQSQVPSSYHHKTLAGGRWQKLSFFEQMANIGSEVNRAVNWQKKNKKELLQSAAERALELADLTIQDKRNIHRLRELTRLREVIADCFFGDNIYGSTPQNWHSYFFAFNYAARLT